MENENIDKITRNKIWAIANRHGEQEHILDEYRRAARALIQRTQALGAYLEPHAPIEGTILAHKVGKADEALREADDRLVDLSRALDNAVDTAVQGAGA